jgi:hypothetical protein
MRTRVRLIYFLSLCPNHVNSDSILWHYAQFNGLDFVTSNETGTITEHFTPSDEAFHAVPAVSNAKNLPGLFQALFLQLYLICILRRLVTNAVPIPDKPGRDVKVLRSLSEPSLLAVSALYCSNLYFPRKIYIV